MKDLERPELFGNIPPDVQFQLHGGGIRTRSNGACLFLDGSVNWTAEGANNQYLCFPVNWDKTMIHSYRKYERKKGIAKIKRIFWERRFMEHRPNWLKNSF